MILVFNARSPYIYLNRSYAIRKTRDTFRQHKNETDPQRIKAFLKEAEQELESLKRQVYLIALRNAMSFNQMQHFCNYS